jgi:hypothetical protein
MARKKLKKRKGVGDVQSDSGYEVESGKADAGGVNPRLQGPWANRYRAQQKARRKRAGSNYKRATNPFD